MLFKLEFDPSMPGSIEGIPEVNYKLTEKVLQDAINDIKHGWHDRPIWNEDGRIIGHWEITETNAEK